MASLPDPFAGRSRRRISLPFVKRLEEYVHGLPPGDRFIAYALGTVVALTSLVGLYGLERHFLVRVPAYGGRLTEGVVGTPRFVNPIIAVTDTDRDLVALTYAGLMGQGPNGNLVPVLAQSYTVSPSGTVYTFTLRPDAKFSDGSPVTADDVAYTVQKAQDPALKSPLLADWANIRAEAVDARTVRFTLPKAYAPFLDDTTLGILPAHLWRQVPDEEFPFSPLDTIPVGAGPFAVSDISQGKNGAITAYHLAAAKTYVGGRPYLDGIDLAFYGDQQTLETAYRKGQIDSAYGVAAPGALRASYSRIFAVFFNPAQDPNLAKLPVREALSLSVDRTALTTQTLGGYAAPVTGPVPGADAVDATSSLAQAKSVLTAGGWTYEVGQNRWQDKKGASLSVTLKTSNVPELKVVASALKAQWEKFGIPTSIELYDPNDLTQQVIRPRAYSSLLFGEVLGRTPDLYAFWDTAERQDPGLNIANYSNKQVDAVVEKLRGETDPAQRAIDLAKADSLVAADYPAAFLYTPDFVYAVPKDLQGVTLASVSAPSDRFANVAHWYRDTELVWPFFAKRR